MMMVVTGEAGMADESLAKNFDFSIVSQWRGYNSANDKTNVADNVYVQGSQNMYKKLSGNVANRPGLKRIGAVNPAVSPVPSEFVWNTSWGATYILAVSDNRLWVIIDEVWYPLDANTSFGTELVTNGSFTGSATGWTLGVDWAYSSNHVVHTPGTTDTVNQFVTTNPGSTYQVLASIGGTVGTLTIDILIDGIPTDPHTFNAGAGAVAFDILLETYDANNLLFTPSSDFDGTLDTVSVKEVIIDPLGSTRYVFDKWWDNTEKKDRALFVTGNSNIYSWSGGSANVLSSTSNTITKTGSTTWQQAGFSTTAGQKKIMIGGIEFTYTGGENTTTLTGVTPNTSGITPGIIALQSIVTTSNTPAAGFNNDFIKVINNQAYIGSYTSRLCYISANDDYTDYVVPTPRLPGDPELLTLDATLNGIGVRTGKAHISFGSGEWAVISFQNITVGTDLTQQTVVDVKPVAKLAAAYAHEFIDNVGDNLVYLSKDQQVRTFGDFNDVFVAAYPSLSQEIATELMAENFTGGGLRCIADFTYVTAPTSGKTYLYQVRQAVDANNQVVVERLWHSPFIWNATRIDNFNGTVIAFSNANPQYYQTWDTGQWHDDSPSDEPLPYSCVFAPSYRTHNRRQGLFSFDKLFTEGYITEGTPLNVLINYNFGGATNQITAPVNSLDRPAFLFIPGVGSLGDSSLGDKPMGDEIEDETINEDLPKFKVINSISLINCFEYQPVYSSDTPDAQWEILALGTNVHLEDQQDATFIINKQRNV